jgi:hypothetical protein
MLESNDICNFNDFRLMFPLYLCVRYCTFAPTRQSIDARSSLVQFPSYLLDGGDDCDVQDDAGMRRKVLVLLSET